MVANGSCLLLTRPKDGLVSIYVLAAGQDDSSAASEDPGAVRRGVAAGWPVVTYNEKKQ
jgi:hypothetical protein